MSEKKCCRVCLKEIRNKATFTDLMLAPDPVVFLRDGELPADSYLHCYYFCLNPNETRIDVENLSKFSYICGTCKILLLRTVDFITQSQKNEDFLKEIYDIQKEECFMENSEDCKLLECDMRESPAIVEEEELRVTPTEPYHEEQEFPVKDLDEIEILESAIVTEVESDEYELIESCDSNTQTDGEYSGDEEISYEALETIINNTRKKICKNSKTSDIGVEYQNEYDSYDELEEIIKIARSKVLKTNESLANDKKEKCMNDSSEKAIEMDTVEIDNGKWKVVPKKLSNNGFACMLCRKHFHLQSLLFDHYDNEHDQDSLTFPCDICKWRNISSKALIFHKYRVHKNIQCENCEICGQAVLPSNLKAHRKRHKTDVQYECANCDRIFYRLGAMKQHYKAIHGNKMRRYECHDCNRHFFSEEKLNLHRVAHDENNEVIAANFLCHICSKTFLKKFELYLHLKLHNGNTFKCPQCGKEFLRRQAMEYHMRSHAKDFAYACNFCLRRFGTWSNMETHVKRYHSGVRYKCKICDKRFINLSGITVHSYKHLGYPIYCKICGKGFPVKEKFRRHLRGAHRKRFEENPTEDTIDAYIERHRVPNVSSIREEYKE